MTVAGMVSRMRTTTTKNGNQMAFATVDDMQGSIELVIFPKTWEKYAHLVQMEAVLVATGKVDNEGSDPKVLVDDIRLLQESDLAGAPAAVIDAPSEPWQGDIETDRFIRVEVEFEEPPVPPEQADWPVIAPVIEVQKPELEVEIDPPAVEEPENSPPVADPPPSTMKAPKEDLPPVNLSPAVLPAVPSSVSPSFETSSSTIHMVTVTFNSTGEKERDVRRLKRIHGLLNSNPGRDRFCFLVYEKEHRHLLDFPNDSTSANSELLRQLTDLVGKDNVRIESL